MVEGGTACERKLADQKHAAGVFVLRGQFRHQHQRGDVVRLVAVVGHHRPGEIAGFDRVEKLGRANDIGLGRLGAVCAGQRREGVEREFTEARFGARDLAVIGGRIARRLLVVASRLLGPVQRFRGAAAPVGAARQRDRVLVAFGNLQEVRIGGRGIVQVAQRDPSGHELLLGAVVRAVGRRGGGRHVVGVLRVARIEQLAGKHAPLHPPLVVVVAVAQLFGNGLDQRHRFGELVGAAKHLDAGEFVADVVAGGGRNRVERSFRRGLAEPGNSRLGDQNLVGAEPLRRAQAAVGVVLLVEAAVHPRLVVGGCQDVAERLGDLAFNLLRERLAAPG